MTNTRGKPLNLKGIARLPDDRWRVRVTIRHPSTKKQISRERTVDGDLNDARAAREELHKEMMWEVGTEALAPGADAPISRRSTLAAYGHAWLTSKGARLKASTRDRYVQTLAHHILPPLGERRLQDITRRDIEAWCAETEEAKQPNGKPYARDTVEGWWRVLTAIVRDACSEHGLADPTSRVTPPQIDSEPVREQGTYSHDEVGLLLRTLREHWSQWYEEAYICAFTGARAGELYAVTWPQVHFDRGVIEIDRAHWRGEVATPKTRKGKRTVALTTRMVSMLRDRRARMVRTQAKGLEQGLVFPNVHGGMRLPGALKDVLIEASKVAELPFPCTPQVLRRTFNTRLLEAGVDRIVIRSMMGHTREEMTERYAGVRVELKRAAALALEQACEADLDEDRE